MLCVAGVEGCREVNETLYRIRLTHPGPEQRSVSGGATGEGEKTTCTQTFSDIMSSPYSSVDARPLFQDCQCGCFQPASSYSDLHAATSK